MAQHGRCSLLQVSPTYLALTIRLLFPAPSMLPPFLVLFLPLFLCHEASVTEQSIDLLFSAHTAIGVLASVAFTRWIQRRLSGRLFPVTGFLWVVAYGTCAMTLHYTGLATLAVRRHSPTE